MCFAIMDNKGIKTASQNGLELLFLKKIFSVKVDHDLFLAIFQTLVMSHCVS